MTVLAVVGLSGVGKTTAINRLADKVPFLHLQASALIQAERVARGYAGTSSEDLRRGPVLDNQSLLICGFRRASEDHHGLVVLDGHVLIDSDNGMIKIPSSVFGDIGCDHIAVLTDDPHEIWQRRRNDVSRKRPSRSVQDLNEQQELICIVAAQIAGELGIHITEHSSSDGSLMELIFGMANRGAV
ncbi:MAG TPA: AAA family ATPase [Sphingomicrobium sp.]|nr:AAA family ATPase [Sphingomicrobium sp.]